MAEEKSTRLMKARQFTTEGEASHVTNIRRNDVLPRNGYCHYPNCSIRNMEFQSSLRLWRLEVLMGNNDFKLSWESCVTVILLVIVVIVIALIGPHFWWWDSTIRGRLFVLTWCICCKMYTRFRHRGATLICGTYKKNFVHFIFWYQRYNKSVNYDSV